MARAIYLPIALFAYMLFLATFLYLVGFVGGIPGLPRTVDLGPTTGVAAAAGGDLALIAMFGVQHSVMARPAFKRWWARIVPPPVERSVYVLAASVMLILLFVLWRPIAVPVWTVSSPAGTAVLWGLFAIGWGIVLLSTFLINHFELFGLHQVWAHLRSHPDVVPRFRTPFLYRAVRHPLYTGFIIAFWATPAMTVGHLLLASGMSLYILVGIAHEERDLIALFGTEYRQYRARVGMLVPGLGRRRA